MQALKRISIITVAMLLLLLGAGFLLPGSWQVERETLIHAPPSAIFPYLNSLRKWPEWTVWGEPHEVTEIKYSGPDAGPGATSRWLDRRGRGVLKIMQSRNDRTVDYELMYNGGEQRINGKLVLIPEANGTRVVWRMAGTVGSNPLLRYAGLLQVYWLGRELDQNLSHLRDRLEQSQR
jgi:Polyketide cyclase / dehydrase and lipid transport